LLLSLRRSWASWRVILPFMPALFSGIFYVYGRYSTTIHFSLPKNPIIFRACILNGFEQSSDNSRFQIPDSRSLALAFYLESEIWNLKSGI